MSPQLQLDGLTLVARDTGLPPAQPGYDYAEAALTAWLSAQVASFEIDDADRALVPLRTRLAAADGWFRLHGRSHPDYDRCYALRACLEREERLLEVSRWFRITLCWTACKDLFIALQYVGDRQAWVAAHASGLDVSSPFTIWAALRGTLRAPGGWPPAKGEEYIRTRARQLEPWNRTAFERRLDRRRKRSGAPA